MLISIIIPAYNSAKYISLAVKSVLNQTYQDFELLIIDDGSTDNTKEIIESFKDKRIEYIYQNNTGAASARNTGIKKAKGEYIAFLDADDRWKPDKLARQIKEITCNPETAMIYSAIEIIYEEISDTKTVRFKKYNNNDFIKSLLVDPFKSIPLPSTVLIKKSSLHKAGEFNSDYFTGEDWDLWLRVASFGECRYIDEVLVTKLTHSSSITNSMDLELTGKTHFELLNNFFEKNPSFNSLKNRAYSNVYYDLACRYFARNNNKADKYSFFNLFKSFTSYPQMYFTKNKLRFTAKVLINHA